MSWENLQYAALVKDILNNGEERHSRAGATLSLFAKQLTIDLQKEGFPLLKGRKIFYGPVLGELAALLRGPTCVEDFKKFGCNYWDAWADKDGKLMLDYGNAWLNFNGVNQLDNLVDSLTNNPTDRRMLITGWRPDRLAELSLPCCHLLYQWYVRDDTYLDMLWYQRSVDVMVGLPSDIILASMWTMLLAKQCNYLPGTIHMCLGDTHIYENHISGAVKYLRKLRTTVLTQPFKDWALDPAATVYNFEPSMFTLGAKYNPTTIKFNLNV